MSSVEVLPGGRGAPKKCALTRNPRPGVAMSITHDSGLAMAVAAIAEPELTPRPLPRLPDAVRLPDRPAKNAHKGTFGQVVVVADSLGFTGAAYLASTAAARTGAGYVRLMAAESIYTILAVKCAEVVVTQAPEVAQGVLGHAVLEPVRALLSRCRCHASSVPDWGPSTPRSAWWATC